MNGLRFGLCCWCPFELAGQLFGIFSLDANGATQQGALLGGKAALLDESIRCRPRHVEYFGGFANGDVIAHLYSIA